MYLKFWGKTLLYRFAFGGFGYYKELKQYKDESYVHVRDKHPVRKRHDGTHGWKDSNGDIVYRDYDSYEEYLLHQRQKLDEMLKIHGGFNNRTITEYRLKFFRRFKHIPSTLPKEARIVCLGARQGTEVEVLRDLGYINAYGIDLNPGPDNKLVRTGDFMRMDEENSSVDLLYSNCVDHAYDLESCFAEHARVMKPEGYVLYDLSLTEEGGPFEAVSWKRDEDLFLMMLRHFKHVVKVESELRWKWILMQGGSVEPDPIG